MSKTTGHRGCFAVWPGRVLRDAPFASRRALSFAVAASMAATPLTFLNSWKHTRAPTPFCRLRSLVPIRWYKLPLQCGLHRKLL